MRKSTLLVLAWSLCAAGLYASDFFVSPDATPSGQGSTNNPWTFQAALANPESLKAGDTVWVQPGTYQGLFRANIHGAPAAPIIFRNFLGGRAIIDGQLNLGTSSDVWIWGLEFIDSNKTGRSNPFDTIDLGSSGLGKKVINCLIHDCCIGIAGGSTTAELYGNVMWYCGKSSLEHGIYVQNDGLNGPKTIENNVIVYSSGFGIHCYGASGPLKSLEIAGNIVCGSGAMTDTKGNILLGGASPVADGVVEQNDCATYGGRGIELGYSAGITNDNVVVRDNRTFGSYPFWLHSAFQSMGVSNNVSISQSKGAVAVDDPFPFSLGPYEWNNNRYYSLRPGFSFWTNHIWISFNVWKSLGSLDIDSTFQDVDSAAVPDSVSIRVNRYDSKRANIAVWNWSGMKSTVVDVSGILNPGDGYEIRSAYNFFGKPVTSGTYGGGTITIPLTDDSLAPVLYWNPPHLNDSYFYNIRTNLQALILLGTSSGAVSSPLFPPSDLRVASPP